MLSETWRFSKARQVYHDQIAAISDEYKLELNLMDQTAYLRRIGPTGFEKGENLIEELERPELSEAITGYLDQNRRVDVSE